MGNFVAFFFMIIKFVIRTVFSVVLNVQRGCKNNDNEIMFKMELQLNVLYQLLL